MTRLWNYIGFAVCFAGFGYVGLLLLRPQEYLGLPPLLHALGGGAVAFVPVRSILYVVGLRRAAAGAMSAADSPKPAAGARPLRRKATYPIRQVAPRSQFGLRGAPDQGA